MRLLSVIIYKYEDIEILTKPLQRGKFVLDFGEYGINFVAYRLHACGFVEPLRLENLIEVYKVNIQSIKVSLDSGFLSILVLLFVLLDYRVKSWQSTRR